MDYRSKPEASSYRRICHLLGCQPEACLLVEDTVHNLLPAKDLKMITVLVDEDGAYAQDVDYVISRIEDIGELMSRIDGRQNDHPCQGP